MDRFAAVELTAEQQEDVASVRYAFTILEARIEALIVPGREKALALTKLEEAAMWAVKAISREER